MFCIIRMHILPATQKIKNQLSPVPYRDTSDEYHDKIEKLTKDVFQPPIFENGALLREYANYLLLRVVKLTPVSS